MQDMTRVRAVHRADADERRRTATVVAAQGDGDAVDRVRSTCEGEGPAELQRCSIGSPRGRDPVDGARDSQDPRACDLPYKDTIQEGMRQRFDSSVRWASARS